MKAATPLAWLKDTKTVVLGSDTEVTFLPGGGYMTVLRNEADDGVLELRIESFDRFGMSEGSQTARIRGARLGAMI